MTRCLLVAILWLLVASSPARAAEPPPTLIVAHRGLLRHAPENTLANFRACLELRLGFEFDVQRTKDGHLICMHDGTVNRTTDGTGLVDQLTFAQIRELDAGSWFDPKFAGEKVPTVEEVLKLVADYRKHEVLVAVDLKVENIEEDVARLAQKLNVLQRLVFIGRTISDQSVRSKISLTAARAQAAVLVTAPDELRSIISGEKGSWIYLRFFPSTAEMRIVRMANKKVFMAGPLVSENLPENWGQATSAGIDAVLTDYPLEMRAFLQSRAAAKP
jgi:glycerophosphoryl diester phosphodiesterase